MKRAAVGLIIVAGALISGIPAYAHHSFAATYFEDKSLTIEGNVVDFDFRNPHSLLILEVPDDGTGQGRATWLAEWRSAGRLLNDGVSKDTLHPGDHVIVTGSPGHTANEHKIHLKKINRPVDGFLWDQGKR
jgi:hypothetical protein